MTPKEKQVHDLERYHQVMALSNFQICQYMADIEGLQTYTHSGEVRVQVISGGDYDFNPLIDNNLCFALMEKYEVVRTYEAYDFIGWNYHVLDGANPIVITERQDFEGNDAPPISMNKAVCLAIILNAKTAY